MIRERINCQYLNVFVLNNSFAYIYTMSDRMRQTLKNLMEKHGDNDYSLAEKSGVPQPTIFRFMSGKHSTMSSNTVEKLAAAYNINESQLRGDLPLDDTPFNQDIQEATHANQGNQISLLKSKMIQMIIDTEDGKITPEKLELFAMTLDAKPEKIPTLEAVTYAINHPQQKYNARRKNKKRQNGD